MAEARSLWERSLALHRELGDTRSIALTLHNLSEAARALGDLAEARRLSAQSIQLFDELQDRPLMAVALRHLAESLGDSGDYLHAARLLGAAEALREAVGATTASGDSGAATEQSDAAATARSALGDSAFDAAWREGRSMTFEHAVAYALEAIGDASPTSAPSHAAG